MSDHSTEKEVQYKSLDFIGFPGYRVGSDGSVWSIRTTRGMSNKWKMLRPSRLPKGYLIIQLCNNGKNKTIQVHRLVLEAFIGPCPEGMQCRHFPDQSPTNNRLENLSWSTQSVNQRDRAVNGTESRGERSGKAKLNNEKVLKIREIYGKGKHSLRAIGRMFGVCVDCIIQVVDRVTWTHI